MTAFFDTNILVYSLENTDRGDIARALIAADGIIAVQSLNELALVLRRKYRRSHAEMLADLAEVAGLFADPVPLTMDIHREGLRLAARYQLAIYDSMLLAAALHAGCTIFYSEDLTDGQIIDGRLTIRNPFA
ncbi:PIN domain-containing protein [Sandarakinorhabdus sp.]|uniref:PIN domain-containing protein n=1 Tax=Sandarakinorhabdus sp. TaxID=1916663 RepID=UPI003F70D8FD